MKKVFSFMGRLKGNQSGFTLVELLVVVAIVVALAAASVTSVIRFAGKGESGAQSAESDSVQAAFDSMMADNALIAVTARDSSTGSSATNNFGALPVEGALGQYLRDNPTKYFYCWDTTGKAKQLTSTLVCPAGPY
jgi:prepilin-type N-terminal cleavage/methylation domain-containing protein